MTDAELVNELRRRATEPLGYAVAVRDLFVLAADRLEALAFQLVGEEKARHLLLKGMEGQCELMDGLKQDVRRLAAERDAAVARVAALEVCLKPFAEAGRLAAEDDEPADYFVSLGLRKCPTVGTASGRPNSSPGKGVGGE